MIVFLKIRACSIARKRVWHPGVRDVTVLCAQPQAHSRRASAQHDAQDLLSDGAGADVELCGILVVLLLSKECTASCLQRAF